MVVDMFATHYWSDRMGMVYISNDPFVFEFGPLCSQLGLGILVVTVVKRAMVHSHQVVMMFFRLDVPLCDWLNRSMVMVLMYFLVHCGSDILVLCAVDILMGNAWSYLLVDSGVMMARLVPTSMSGPSTRSKLQEGTYMNSSTACFASSVAILILRRDKGWAISGDARGFRCFD